MIKILWPFVLIFLFACTKTKPEQNLQREQLKLHLTYESKVSFKFPYTYTVQEPISVGFYQKRDGNWTAYNELKEFDSVKYRHYSDTTFSFHRFKKGHTYGENLFPPDTLIVLRKKVKLPNRDSSTLRFDFPSRDTQNYLFDLSDSAGNVYEFSYYSWYRCSDPHCESKHGHMNFNNSVYANMKYAWSLKFNELDKRSFRIYFPKEGRKLPLELVAQLLKLHDFPEAALEALEDYYLK